MIRTAASAWNSLEVAKLTVGALTPILLAGVGYWINRRLKSLEAAQWAQQKIIDRRITAYDQLAPLLNQLFCFFAYVGPWKDMEPPRVVGLKRQIDQCAHISAPLFDTDFLQFYNGVIDLCFTTFVGWGQDAKLRTHTDRRRQAVGESWSAGWESCFAEASQATAPSQVKTAYATLVAYLARSIGATEIDAHILGAGRLPGGFDLSSINVVSRTPEDAEVGANRDQPLPSNGS